MNKNTVPVLNDQQVRQRRDQLLFQISTDQRLPSLGIAISTVIKIASTGEESVNKLANFILADVGLTKDILNLANSVSYRKSQGTSVTTISKAIFILGFDVVKTSALGMLMLECFNEQDQSLYYELTHSLCSSIIARECVSRSMYQDAEEASISALFKNMGQVLISAQAPDLYREIMQPVKDGTDTLHHSAVQHLGCSLAHFGSMVLQQWNMPDSIVQAIGALPFGEIKKSRHRSEWVKQVAAFSSDAAEVVMRNTQFMPGSTKEINFENEKYTKELMQRYGAALELDPKILPSWLDRAVKETEQLVLKLGMRTVTANASTKGGAATNTETVLPDDLLMSSATEVEDKPNYPSGKPHNARDLLLAGVMEMTQTISTGKFQLNDLVLQLLEILHGSLGFQFVTASLKDVKSERYVARISLGQDWHNKQKNFNFSSKGAGDLFHLALKNNADLMIGDTSSTKIHDLRPEWHLTHFPDVKSLMILPLIVNGKAIGLIYADRNCVAPEGVPPDETSLVKTMKGQLLAAMSK
ncbi:HDOD domain-containing protein [Solimicrobium silvestre]|uniref:HDOD domain n=1 Tax=Solimicrobium silvestre TaxID=2099400 RepID=A0A2S9H453_9BURK|nr:HDOD domain-containing protein [Solimicrobium silvestre]PRC94762.1 HDOD domain [Solimicrobium silvestre]